MDLGLLKIKGLVLKKLLIIRIVKISIRLTWMLVGAMLARKVYARIGDLICL